MIPLIIGGIVVLVLGLSFKDSFRDISGSIFNITKTDTQKEREAFDLKRDKRGIFANIYHVFAGETATREVETGVNAVTPATPQTGEQKQTPEQNRYNRYSRRSQKYQELKNG